MNQGEEIFYGGDVSEKQGQFEDTVGYTITLYVISGNEKKVFLSNRIVYETGESISVSGNIGKVSTGAGNISAYEEDLLNNFYCDLVITNSNGIENTYSLQLSAEKVTK